jgi:hypothetical protein
VFYSTLDWGVALYTVRGLLLHFGYIERRFVYTFGVSLSFLWPFYEISMLSPVFCTGRPVQIFLWPFYKISMLSPYYHDRSEGDVPAARSCDRCVNIWYTVCLYRVAQLSPIKRAVNYGGQYIRPSTDRLPSTYSCKIVKSTDALDRSGVGGLGLHEQCTCPIQLPKKSWERAFCCCSATEKLTERKILFEVT